ncbi:kininogen-1 isoform X1 [Ochotona curzoniae]|uniref:kininogen-1 isoform X1 n=1 Tax=Ochotona curzoniae TaxID=130825 RepID=UPI001B345A2C|nr:kininogen-1 isoform X1 [Ochotona curzoniae]
MKLIALLVFCSRLLLSETQELHTEEIDCNNEDVFKAVDAALEKYNTRSQSGNQFVLHRVTDVKKTVGSDIFYSLKYQIKEGDCPVQDGKSWQDCNYRDAQEAATGECTAIVSKRKSGKFSVATQTCQITPAEGPVVTAHYDCLGCVHPVSTKSPELEPVLRHAVQHFNNHTKHSHLFTLQEVKGALKQVVVGWNFEITYTIIQTNCSKEHFLFLTPDCKSLSSGDIAECIDHAYMDPQLRITSFSQRCDILPGEEFIPPPTRICAGCPKDIPVDSPLLQEVLTHSTKKLNEVNNGTSLFKIDTVKKATVQVVAGQKFAIEFTAKETTCSKESNQELTESCEIKSPGQNLECKANVHVIPWEQKIYPTVNCQPLEMVSFMKRPPGFSPFRSVLMEQGKEGTTVSPSHTFTAPVQDEEQDPEKEQRSTRGHGWYLEEQKKHSFDHDHKHGHDQTPGHKKGHGLGHGHKKQHGLGYGHQQELNYDVEHQGGHGLNHGQKRGRGLALGQKNKHKLGHGHEKHKNKGKNKGKHSESSSEEITTSAQTQEKTEGPTSVPFLTQADRAVTLSGFQDSDLLATTMPNIPPVPTESDDDWIPDVKIGSNIPLFNLISDFPETTSPKCPGRPWKPVSVASPETSAFDDFDLADALG